MLISQLFPLVHKHLMPLMPYACMASGDQANLGVREDSFHLPWKFTLVYLPFTLFTNAEEAFFTGCQTDKYSHKENLTFHILCVKWINLLHILQYNQSFD